MSAISPKVTAATIAAAAVTILVWVLAEVGIDVPIAVQGATITIATFAAGYLIGDPARKSADA